MLLKFIVEANHLPDIVHLEFPTFLSSLTPVDLLVQEDPPLGSHGGVWSLGCICPSLPGDGVLWFQEIELASFTS
jgi:hypothetical protein